MVNIRSITIGCNWSDLSKNDLDASISNFISFSKDTFERGGISIRTTRLSMSPLSSNDRISQASGRSFVNRVSDLCQRVGIRWFCVPFNLLDTNNNLDQSAMALDIISRFPNAFINLIVANDGQVNHNGVMKASKFIRTVSRMSKNGFDNFRVGITCNSKPNTPFFPFSYHDGEYGFSVALETTDLFIYIINQKINDGIEYVRDELIDKFTTELSLISEKCLEIESATGARFIGIDASLAPFPDGENSVARIIEMLGVEGFGSHSSLFFTSFLTNIIKTSLSRSNALRIGFNGIMYSLLEDDYLALRVKQKNLSLDSLILYSAVCGCGIDMVPVPGDILEEEIAGMIMDVAGLAITLEKPLGVRILPIPNKSANEVTNFNYDFLVDTRVMQVRNRTFKNTNFIQPMFKYLDSSVIKEYK